jgi:hypothetical protein
VRVINTAAPARMTRINSPMKMRFMYFIVVFVFRGEVIILGITIKSGASGAFLAKIRKTAFGQVFLLEIELKMLKKKKPSHKRDGFP